MQIAWNTKSNQERSRIRFSVPTIQFGEFTFQFTRTHTVFFGKIRFCIQSVLLFHNGIESGMTHDDSLKNLEVIIFVMVLFQDSQTLSRGHAHFTLISFDLTGQNFEKC
ncbi:hypothetical protein D1872_238690 [compost metagenome]